MGKAHEDLTEFLCVLMNVIPRTKLGERNITHTLCSVIFSETVTFINIISQEFLRYA